MEEIFSTEPTVDNRGPFEKAFETMLKDMEELNYTPQLETRLMYMQRSMRKSREECLLIDQAALGASKELGRMIGRCIDEVRPGLRYLGAAWIVAGLCQNLEAINRAITTALEEQLITGVAHTTPNCDCGVCDLRKALNKASEDLRQ